MRFVLEQDAELPEEEQRAFVLKCPTVRESGVLQWELPETRKWLLEQVSQSAEDLKEFEPLVRRFRADLVFEFASYLLCVESIEGFFTDCKVALWLKYPGYDTPTWWLSIAQVLRGMIRLREEELKN